VIAVYRLDEVCEVVMGQAPRGETYNDDGDGWPLIAGAGDFGENLPAPKKCTTEATKLSRNGDIVLGIRASIGERVVADGEYCLGRGVAALRAREEVLAPRFLWHWLTHASPRLVAKAKGATFKQVSRQDIGELEISLPSCAEQRRIAEILDKADGVRTNRRSTLCQLDSLTQSIFLDLFGDLASNREGWAKVALSEVTEMVTGFPFRSEEYIQNGDSVRLCRGANILPGRVDWKDLARWPHSKTVGLEQFSLAAGDVVIAMDRPWISEGFKIAQIQQADCPALLVQRVARLRGKREMPNSFLFHLLNQKTFTLHCRPTETTVPHISPKDIRSFVFSLPPLTLQSEFARRVGAVEKLKTAQRASLAEMDALFASLQHRAFNGQL
jgi:type I restriction enzyme S subunit